VKGHKPNCAECLNLIPGTWCSAKRKTVSGSRHIRKCDDFIFDKPNPKPVRPGKPNHPHLIRCTDCEYFQSWGLCTEGKSDLSFLSPLIWRNCEYFEKSETRGNCNSCSYLFKQVCLQSSQPVTNSEIQTTCNLFQLIDDKKLSLT